MVVVVVVVVVVVGGGVEVLVFTEVDARGLRSVQLAKTRRFFLRRVRELSDVKQGVGLVSCNK